MNDDTLIYDLWPLVRELFDLICNHGSSICAYQRVGLYYDVLYQWRPNVERIKFWLSDFAARSSTSIPAASLVELEFLYALSRVNDVLLYLLFAEERSRLRSNEYMNFICLFGFEEIGAIEFSPFYHEIVEAVQDNQPQTKITLIDQVWPGLMLGNLLFSRAGVAVIGGSETINSTLAETSTLYWTYLRKNRFVRDLSHGWGSNSQWATSFRRDYKIGNTFYYNVDGKIDLTCEPPDTISAYNLELSDRIELVKHRCLITVDKPHHDLFPYDDRDCEAE